MVNQFISFLVPVSHFSIASFDIILMVYYRGILPFCPSQLRGWIYGQFIIHVWEGVISTYQALYIHRITPRPGETICLFFEFCWVISALLIGFTSMNCAKTYPVLFSNAFIGGAILGVTSSQKCMKTVFAPNRSQSLVDITFNDVKDVSLNKTCVFCMEEFVEADRVVSLSCKHIYHPRVIRSWLSTSQSCPLCRNPVENP